jgi:Carbon-nitrogen hydrolase
MIEFPEPADMEWLSPRTFFDAAERPGTATERFANIAGTTGLWVVTGLTERGKQVSAQPATDQVYDSAVMIEPAAFSTIGQSG